MMTQKTRILAAANLILLILFPISWFAPLLRAALLPVFGMNEISVISGLQSLWASDVFLALVVTFLAIFAPYMKTIGMALMHFGLLDGAVKPALTWLARLAMADVFLLAIYVVIAKEIGLGRVEPAWGLYLFTGCVIASVAISMLSKAD